MGRHEVMGERGRTGGLRIGPLSPSPAVAVSLSLPAGVAAFGGVGSWWDWWPGGPPHPGAHQGVLLISEPTQGCIPMAHLLVWPSLITHDGGHDAATPTPCPSSSAASREAPPVETWALCPQS